MKFFNKTFLELFHSFCLSRIMATAYYLKTWRALSVWRKLPRILWKICLFVTYKLAKQENCTTIQWQMQQMCMISWYHDAVYNDTRPIYRIRPKDLFSHVKKLPEKTMVPIDFPHCSWNYTFFINCIIPTFFGNTLKP